MVFYEDLETLFVQSLDHETNDYIPLVPLVSAYFFYLGRKEIFADTGYAVPIGLGTIVAGAALYAIGVGQGHRLSGNDYLSLVTLSAVIMWIGGFTFCYGLRAVKPALFPLLFLLFIVPIPTVALGKIVAVLQESSAEATSALFGLAGVPVLREGFVFHLTGISIEVAEACSGIHSAIALLLTSIVAGKLFLTSAWTRLALTLVVFPIAVLKNGLRIVTLTLVGNYIDARILAGPLHTQGGIPFFLVALTFLAVVMWLLRRAEAGGQRIDRLGIAPRAS
ncbi:MAG: exosortase/archaeosortase family protein [Nitrospirota bacterium]